MHPKLGRDCFKRLEKTIGGLSKISLKPDCSAEQRLLDTQMNLFTFNEHVGVGTAAEVYFGMTIGHCPPLRE